jgi:hypothetical protein
MIDPTILKGMNRFFKVNELVEELGSNDSQRRLAAYPGTFLCLHRTRSEAIIERRNPREVEEGNARANPTSKMPSGRTSDSLKSQRPINTSFCTY